MLDLSNPKVYRTCKLLLTKQKWVKPTFFFYSKGNLMVSANKIEILRIAETVAQEKMIDKGIVLAALEEAIVKAAKKQATEKKMK